MTREHILIPYDFSPAADKALETAQEIALKNSADLTLLHIRNGKSDADAEMKLIAIADAAKAKSGLNVKTLLRDGNLLDEITRQASDNAYSLMVIGTHGYKGIREKLLGADILKLLKNIPLPVIVVQKDYYFPSSGINKILFPSSAHEYFINKLKATLRVSKFYDAEVHLYTIEKPGAEISGQMKANIRLAKQEFESAGIKYVRIKEEQQAYSVGYSKQTMAYAKNNNIDLIALITTPTRENYFFADSDKISLLTNEANIPVLCTSDKMIDQE